MRPRLAVTMGDPGGVGPELAVAVLRSGAARAAADWVAVGSREALAGAGWTPGLCPLVDVGPCGPIRRRPTPEGGRASFAAVRAALDLCARGRVHGMVTGPISKEAWALGGVPYPDHTELLRERTSSPRATMMLAAGRLKAVLVTRHMPLARAPRALTARAVVETAELTAASLRDGLGIARPRLALCALNPHAGEGGLLGDEEERVLRPALALLRRRGADVAGPIPADTAWAEHAAGRFDALLALYHDQALIPLKLADRFGVVNWTIGAPLVRTSPGHGTAFDVAGRGRADASATIAAALWAARVARR
ncbi:MAG TPA: 4-hydroxythreonine-4-phosphate dehydrogenase PdxA [Elusimicrobiota bacterium]|jgi:4-hydroxythreonine-4-phosphate dehydrogenase|nr:4-hydroxythreonine-4-phosphate dehydrogenase PdxA [Elusimicrobiota bacterium]